jgi:hypothetical protein
VLIGALTWACRTTDLTSEAGAPLVTLTIGSLGTVTAGVVAVVTGAGIPTGIVMPLVSTGGGQFAGALSTVPRGPSRTLAVKAYLGTVPAYSATTTIDLVAGSAPRVVLVRAPEAALPPTVDSYTLALDDAAPFVASTTTTTGAAGTTVQLTIKVTYSLLQLGHVPGTPAPNIEAAWASAAPDVAMPAVIRCTTSASGTCTVTVAVSPGATTGQTADLIAMVAGVASKVRLTVS